MKNIILLLSLIIASCAVTDGDTQHNHTALCGPAEAGIDASVADASTPDAAVDSGATDAGPLTDASVSDAGNDSSAPDAAPEAGIDAGPPPYVPCAPALASDDFERAQIGTDWAVMYPFNAALVGLIGGSDLGMMPGPRAFFIVDYRAVTFGADQFSEGVVSLDAPLTWSPQVYTRRAANSARYGFGYNADLNAGPEGWYFKLDGLASPDVRQFLTATGDPWVPGDTLCLEIRGYVLSGYRNGVLMLSGEDTGPNKPAAGRPGLVARLTDGNLTTAAQTPIWESWRGGEL